MVVEMDAVVEDTQEEAALVPDSEPVHIGREAAGNGSHVPMEPHCHISPGLLADATEGNPPPNHSLLPQRRSPQSLLSRMCSFKAYFPYFPSKKSDPISTTHNRQGLFQCPKQAKKN